MPIHISRKEFERKIVIGDVVKIARCLEKELRTIDVEKIEYIVGIVSKIHENEEYIDINIDHENKDYIIRFLRKDKNINKVIFHSPFLGVFNDGYFYEIDNETNISWSPIPILNK